jgi:hypothetical protein
MRRELFGVFGDRDRFERLRSPLQFDRIVAGGSVTVGVRDFALDHPGRSSTYAAADGCCVVWGEAFAPPTSDASSTAEWLFERYAAEGRDAFDGLNGSYVAVVDRGGEAVVATDPIHSTEGFYADTGRGRCFGTDAATLAHVVGSPTVDRRGLCEFLHFGLTFGATTTVSEVRRLPFDGYLTADDVGDLSRFVYRPRRFDYAEELAARLERAVRRRAHYPGRSGMLLSAGFDSRLVLATLPNVDVCYTVGTSTTPEVRTARKLAAQYGASHRTLGVDDGYLLADPGIVQYTQGVRESIHIHHRGSGDEIDTDTVYHGLLLDSLLRGHYLPWDTIRLDRLDRDFPLPRLAFEPDVPAEFADRLGFFDGTDDLLVDARGVDAETPEEFLNETIEHHYRRGFGRADSEYNAMARLGLECKSALPFRNHLADRHLEGFVAADAELIDWHLSTPPGRRHDRTYQRALELIDDRIFRHRPPDRPHRSYQFNQVEQYLRKKLPGLTPFGTPWPDRDRIYDEHDFDRRLFPDRPDLHDLPPRVKLRINDFRTWFERVASDPGRPVDEFVPAPSV